MAKTLGRGRKGKPSRRIEKTRLAIPFIFEEQHHQMKRGGGTKSTSAAKEKKENRGRERSLKNRGLLVLRAGGEGKRSEAIWSRA